MKQALVLVEEIKRKKKALVKTKSEYLMLDYLKSIRSDINELRIYCKYKKLDFSELKKQFTE